MTDINTPVDKLVSALIEAQAEIRPIQPNAENPFLHSKYADLGSHIEGIMPALRKHGLTVTQLIFGEGGSIGVETILAHTSGQRLSSKISLPVADEKGKSGAQVAGSIVSYLRRYALAAIVNAYSGDDDDAVETAKKPKQSWTSEQVKTVLGHTKATGPEQAIKFLDAAKLPKTVTPQQIEAVCKAYAAKLADGLEKEDALEDARKVVK